MINEAHGTSLYGLDDSIKKLYNDMIDEIDIKNYKNEYTIEYNKFIHNDKFISFKVKNYKIVFNINDYFDIENNYTITIYIRDIIDDVFLNNVKNYKNLLDDYYGETDIDNNNILLILNSHNLKINPKPFFIICIHEMQHLYTETKHKNKKISHYFIELSNRIQKYISNANIFNDNEKDCLNTLFYVFFNQSEISSYTSQLYGELKTTLKNNNSRNYKNILKDTDSYILLQSYNNVYKPQFENIKSEKLFEICKYIFYFNIQYNINNKFSKYIEDFYNKSDKDGFKSFLLKIFNKNSIIFLRTIEKITDNYRLCESVYLGKLNLISNTSKSFINECKRKLNKSTRTNT